ncbi:MAG: DUF3606 domain-containing protein [Pedobacter sp.]|nr:MAG: DUF3606 domain-containing protein [Pedobacter sp.]
MADDKTKQDGRDDSRIDANDVNEVYYAATKLGVASQVILNAIAEVGNKREDVERYVKGN